MGMPNAHGSSPTTPSYEKGSSPPSYFRRLTNTRTFGSSFSEKPSAKSSTVSASIYPVSSRSSSFNKHESSENKASSRFSELFTTWITDWWGLELISWLTSALSLLAIVISDSGKLTSPIPQVTLEIHKNKPVQELPLKITLNAFISILAQMAQMGMMKPVVECISQLKWLWFIRKQKLSHFGVLDDASRGPTGSLILLGQLHGLHLVSLGAIITIISIAFGPFTQQIVSYPPKLQPIGIATTQQVINFTDVADGTFITTNPGIVAAIYEGLGSGAQSLSSVTPSSCSTGNCTWNEYSSIGMCVNVTDISAFIVHQTCNTTALDKIFEVNGLQNPGYSCYNYTLPFQGMGLYSISDTMNSESPTFGNVFLSSANPEAEVDGFIALDAMTITSSPSSSSLMSYYMIYQPGLTNSGTFSPNSALPKPVAYQMSLDFCLHTYSTNVSHGLVNTFITSSQNFPTHDIQSLTQTGFNDQLEANLSTITVGNQTFTVDVLGSVDLLSTAHSIFDGTCSQIVTKANVTEDVYIHLFGGGGIFNCEVDAGTSLIDALTNTTDTDPFTATSAFMENIAISLTNTFRNGGSGDNIVIDFEGIALAPVDFVETQYLWLLLPIGLIFLSLVFLIATISKSDRLGSRVWKSSNVAILQGLHLDLHTKLGGLSSISEMEEKAEKLKVRFDMEGGKAGHGVDYRLIEEKGRDGWRG